LSGSTPASTAPESSGSPSTHENAGLVFDEWCPENENMVVPELAEGIKRRNKEKWGGIKPRYVIDPSARNRATVNAEQVEAEFARAGIFCQHGQNDRAAGILEMKARLQHGSLRLARLPHLDPGVRALPPRPELSRRVRRRQDLRRPPRRHPLRGDEPRLAPPPPPAQGKQLQLEPDVRAALARPPTKGSAATRRVLVTRKDTSDLRTSRTKQFQPGL
jgi:hypothetical protein